jgi:hypothetical protein
MGLVEGSVHRGKEVTHQVKRAALSPRVRVQAGASAVVSQAGGCCWSRRFRKTGHPGCSGGDGLQVSIVKGWIALVAHSLGRIDVVGKSVAGLSEPVHLIVQSL